MQLDVHGANLRVEVDGAPQLPALLLWPPGRCTLRVWDHLVPLLAERFRVVRVDVRGCGESAPDAAAGEAQYTFAQYAEDAGAVLDHLDIERCHVWSQSWGTRAAIVFCALASQRVLSAALYAANTGPADVPAQREGTERAAELRREAGIETLPPPTGFIEHADVETARRATQAAPTDLAAMVPRLAMPVLIATGSHDPNLTSSRVVAAEAPRATLRVLEPVGHNAILEHPQMALDAFLEFHDGLGT